MMRIRTNRTVFALAYLAFGALAACGGERLPPKQLTDARSEFQQAKTGLAMQLDPTDLHVAQLALQQAEQAQGHGSKGREFGQQSEVEGFDMSAL